MQRAKWTETTSHVVPTGALVHVCHICKHDLVAAVSGPFGHFEASDNCKMITALRRGPEGKGVRHALEVSKWTAQQFAIIALI